MDNNNSNQNIIDKYDSMNINLKFYRNFVEVVESGSLSRAVEKTHTAQTALTMEMQILENKIGTKLIVRNKGKRKLELTDAGRAFYQRAKDLCYLFANIHEEMASIIDGSSGILRLSISASRAQSLCKEILIPFFAENPGVKFEIIEDILPKLEKNVQSSFTELAISNSPLHNKENFEILHQIPEKIYAVFNPQYFCFGSKKNLPLKDLSQQPVALSKGSSSVFLDSMTTSGYIINCLAKCSSRSTALSWAEAGAAIAIIPRNSYDIKNKKLCYLQIDDPRFFTEKIVYKLAGKPLSPLAQRFLTFYLDKFKQISL